MKTCEFTELPSEPPLSAANQQLSALYGSWQRAALPLWLLHPSSQARVLFSRTRRARLPDRLGPRCAQTLDGREGNCSLLTQITELERDVLKINKRLKTQRGTAVLEGGLSS